MNYDDEDLIGPGPKHGKKPAKTPGRGHNSSSAGGPGAYHIVGDELRQFIERAEQLAEEKADIAEAEKEVFAEAKARGYDTKIMRKIIAERKRSRDDISEEEAILELYRQAMGMV